VEYGEPGLDLLLQEAVSTSTRTLLASPGDGGPWGWRTMGMASLGMASLGMADPGDGGPWGWRAANSEVFCELYKKNSNEVSY